ncbi:hypothetical protein HB779_20940 (plasmid) [Phyllobacterium sp. 628]|nr:hypothetical protein HB779_20940 [Phyllobacterium sp. 628]
MLPLLSGKRVALIDDVISSGTSIVAGLNLLKLCNIAPVCIGAAMLQSSRWIPLLNTVDPRWPAFTRGVIRSPILKLDAMGGWLPES